MANDVFANNLEIACKSADGKAIACMPDVCWSPPPPAAGPITIPYANTAYAKDMTKGSKSVFISSKPVVLRDKSYFKTSTGNEAATNAFQKGVVSGKIKGKCYFTSWSPNVMIEGYNVCRHTDSTTHNHGSTSNTGPWKYLDTSDKPKACKREKEAVEKKCKPEKDPKNKKKNLSWKQSHCAGLNKKPRGEEKDKAKTDSAKQTQKSKADKLAKELSEKAEKLQKQYDKIEKKVAKATAEKLAKLGAKSLAKGFLGPIGWAWTAYDVVSTGLDVADMAEEVLDFKNKLEEFDKEAKRLQKLMNLNPEYAQAMSEMAMANACTRAKRCQLVPYTSSNNKNKTGDVGCCPGQTGHHLIPKSYMQTGKKGKNPETDISKNRCSNYDENKAPTVCLEGTSHNQGGTHALIHEIQDERAADALNENNNLTYKQSKNVGIASLKEATGANCSAKCLEAQLDNYHKEACPELKGNSNVNPVKSTNGKVLEKPAVDIDVPDIP